MPWGGGDCPDRAQGQELGLPGLHQVYSSTVIPGYHSLQAPGLINKEECMFYECTLRLRLQNFALGGAVTLCPLDKKVQNWASVV